MRQLPSGTVTFLFTDIEGSTRLLEQLGAEAYAEALAEHRQVIRSACAAQGGVEVDTEGDAFFVAFPTAQGALTAAAAFSEGLAAGPIKVRVGVHTGTPLLADDRYVGMDVHRAARIAAAGHGGQVLVSAATAALTGSEGLRDLGEHRFKDLSAPERVYQLGEGEFPRLKTLYQTNLPVPATPFLGREAELAAASGLLADGVRLLTLSGPGGTGKTRLALQAAAAAADGYPDGIWWVPLAPLNDPALVLPTAGEVLGAKGELPAHIAGKRLLLLLDNFEHLIDAARELAGLIGACPELTVLVTSRERLQVAGEHEYAVPAMASPDGLELFAARARALGTEVESDPAAGELCVRLDNLPLALELAAARTKLFSPAQLLERLGQRLDLFKGGRDADPRQRTLRATIEWSYELLTPDEQRLFAGLAVFAGGCRYEAAEAVCDADEDTLQSLLDKSVLRRRKVRGRTGDPRFWMLETIREFALEQLGESGEEDDVRRRHAEYFRDLAEWARPRLLTASQRITVQQLGDEVDNLRQAIAWSLDYAPGVALAITSALEDFWLLRGHLAEARRWLERGLTAAATQPPALRARALGAAAWVALRQVDPEGVTRFAEEGLAIAREIQETSSMVTCLTAIGVVTAWSGDREQAELLHREAAELARAHGDQASLSTLVAMLGELEFGRGDFAAALELYEEALRLFRALGDDWNSAICLVNVGLACVQLGRQHEARERFSEGLELSASLETPETIAAALLGLATVEVEPARAIRLLGASDRLLELTGAGQQPAERTLSEQTKALLRTKLVEDAFAEAWSSGRAMSVGEAVAYASALD
jgi:predicted ATPase